MSLVRSQLWFLRHCHERGQQTIPQPVYRTSNNQTIVLFGHVEIGEPVWDDEHRSQTIVEKVHDDFGAYWEEQDVRIKPEDTSTEPTVEALQY